MGSGSSFSVEGGDPCGEACRLSLFLILLFFIARTYILWYIITVDN
ncbi:hypothetical protein CLOSYM_04752 [[Clostridium] symbiosum ATCC 14940]|uniref:Uncharacterized protein n=1 Tax=[Clostridium] symbiosum ATCC 14940 TaxID=411472 RepID=A0ABC9TQS7_CLOSY|nr:hypothetical protein CLOSYM_04752 [[Clostridium] symbiosum ATCC 14940]